MTQTITPVHINDHVTIGGELPVFIMGPCVIESEDHVLRMAERLKQVSSDVGVPIIFKASFDKANRTSISSFRGPGLEAGLRLFERIKQTHELPVTTDIHEVYQVKPAAEVIDLLQVPALLSRQTDLVVACAESGRPCSIKKGQFMAPWDCKHLVDKFHSAGGKELVLIERGTSFGYNTLVSDMRSLSIMRSLGVPVIYDGTHSVQAPGGLGSASGGAGYLAPSLMRAAMAVGVEGIFMETHDQPQQAKSDGPNMVPTDRLTSLLNDLMAIHKAIGRPAPAEELSH